MKISDSHRVAVTGFGAVTALGVDIPSTWESVMAGRTARGPITAFPTEGCRVAEGAQAQLPEIASCSPKQVARMSRAARLAIPACHEALHAAGLLDANGASRLPRLECVLSTTACGMEMGESFLKSVWDGRRQGQGALLANYQAQQQTGQLQRHFGFQGPSAILSNACASGSNAIGHAADMIRCGMAEVILTGGYDALCELVFCGFDSLLTLAPETCRPFDRHRNGLMLGEGAGFLVLESESHAKSRGATIHGFIAGYGHTTDTGHLTQPNQEGVFIESAVRQALEKASLPASQIGYLNAHGTATPFNDSAETKAYSKLFSAHATRISSTKAALGHTLGAAGSIEAILCLMALKTGDLPPQINLLEPEPDISQLLVGQGENSKISAALSVNLGFGGSTAAVVFTKE